MSIIDKIADLRRQIDAARSRINFWQEQIAYLLDLSNRATSGEFADKAAWSAVELTKALRELRDLLKKLRDLEAELDALIKETQEAEGRAALA